MKRTCAALAAIFVLPASGAFAADASTIDWSAVPASTIPLFYPGQSTYEWRRSPGHPKGMKQVEEGRACVSCHEDDEKDIGAKHVKGSAIEPTPVKDKAGSVDLKVQAAYDDKNAYFRLQWKTQNPYAGDEHKYLQFDGKEWKPYGGPKLDKAVQDGQQPALSEDRVTMMIDDGKIPMFAKQGCWLTCHNGSPGTSNAATADEAAANPLIKAQHLNEVRKYLPATRTEPGDWKTGKSADEIAKLKAEGGFADFIPWYAYRSNPVGMAGDGYILEYRLDDAGKGPFAENEDPATHQPKFMWDEKKAGYKSITVDQLHKAQHFLIKEQNATAFDAKAGWKAGDMVPAYVLSATDASGSAADNKATGTWKDGQWTVVITRPLALANDDDKGLKAGSTYNAGFAVHDSDIAGRGHFVSFVRSIGFGADGKIKAVKLP
jgi:Ethylbenzene dehydrogenase